MKRYTFNADLLPIYQQIADAALKHDVLGGNRMFALVAQFGDGLQELDDEPAPQPAKRREVEGKQ